MPRITCHRPGAGGELQQQLPCGGRLKDVLAPTAYLHIGNDAPGDICQTWQVSLAAELLWLLKGFD